MKLLDLNILIYALDESAPHHDLARAWLDETLSGSATVAFAWHVLVGFARLSTRPVVFSRPLSVDDAFDVIEGWLQQPCVVIVHPTERHTSVLRGLLATVGTAGNLTSDAHLAAVSIEHGADLCWTDGDFRRFPGVRWINPLAG